MFSLWEVFFPVGEVTSPLFSPVLFPHNYFLMNSILTRKSPLFIIGILFFIFGFITWLNSALVPFLKISCELNNFESYFVTFVFYIAYFVFAIPSAKVIDRLGYHQSITLGLAVMALGALLFVPASLTRQYVFFLGGLFLMGAGLALLQTAANPYVAVIGPAETAARRISVMGVCNKLAGVLAPLVFGSVVLRDAQDISSRLSLGGLDAVEQSALLDSLAIRCLVPYIFIVVFLILLSVFVRFSPLPDIKPQASSDPMQKERFRLGRYPRLYLGALALFFYVGAEVISVDSLISYAHDMGMTPLDAKIFPALSMVTFILGYLLGIVGIPRLFSQRAALIGSAVACMLVLLASILTPGLASVYVLVWLGFTHAMIWPAVWALAIDGLGKHTSMGSSFLIMAIVGGALIPLLFGRLVDMVGFRDSYWIMMPCYLYILLYGLITRPAKTAANRSF